MLYLVESEWKTRKTRIDKKLTEAGWKVQPYNPATPPAELNAVAVEEYPTHSGPADYALWVKGRFVGVVEAKKIVVNPQEVLGQAKRYSKTASDGSGVWGEYSVPFLYSSNGEGITFLDVRRSQNLRREISGFHTPAALAEWFERTHAIHFPAGAPPSIKAWRPYQQEAVERIEAALAAGTRALLSSSPKEMG